MKSLGTLLLALLSLSLNAHDNEALSVDKVIDKELLLIFPNDNNVQPNKSDFEVIHTILMSNELGERFVTITLKNTSVDNRIFDHKQLMGLFANGKRRSPYESKVSFEGEETQTLTLSFGQSKFPLLQVYTRGR